MLKCSVNVFLSSYTHINFVFELISVELISVISCMHQFSPFILLVFISYTTHRWPEILRNRVYVMLILYLMLFYINMLSHCPLYENTCNTYLPRIDGRWVALNIATGLRKWLGPNINLLFLHVTKLFVSFIILYCTFRRISDTSLVCTYMY